MGKMLLLLGLLVFAFCSDALAQRNVSFYEEYIDFSLDSSSFCVNGIYSFVNVTDKEIHQQIMFPFAGKMAEIDSIRILNLNTGQALRFNRLESAVVFNLHLSAKDSVDVIVFYRQKRSTKNTYILSSTQSWGKPLETAVYALTVGSDIEIKSFSYEPDTVKVINNQKVYLWKKNDFMPVADFEIILNNKL